MKTIELKTGEVQEVAGLKLTLVGTGRTNKNGSVTYTATVEIDEPEAIIEESTAHKPSKKHK